MRRQVLIVAMLGVASLASAQAEPKKKKPGKWERHYWERIASFEQENATLSAKRRYVVLLGSSSMEGWKYRGRLKKFLPGVPALNRGISADKIGMGKRGILRRLDSSVFACRPGFVFILNGRNNLGRAKKPPVERIARTYRKVVVQIQERSPKTVVCIITCAPVSGRYAVMHPHLLKYNALLRSIAKERRCRLIDLHALLRGPDGLLPKKLTSDGLHFNDQGYEVLGREIRRVLKAKRRG